MLETIFTLSKRSERQGLIYRGAIVDNVGGVKRFSHWITPTIWLDDLPEFLREEFSKRKKTIIKYVKGNPEFIGNPYIGENI